MKRKMMAVLLAMFCVVLAAGFAVADDTITINNGNVNNNTATAEANALAKQKQAQAQKQGQQQSLINNIVTPIQPFNLGAPNPMQPGQAALNTPWMIYLPTVLDCLTYEEASNMSDDFFWNRIEYAPKIKGLSKTNSIRILDYYGKKPGDKVVGFARVFGKKKDITEALIALAAKKGMDNGATGMGVLIRAKNRTNSKGLSFGGGAGVGAQVPCTGSAGMGVTFGAWLSSVAIEDEIELTIVYLVTSCEKPCPTPEFKQPIPEPEPEIKKPCPPCDEQEILKRLREVEERLEGCFRYSHVNMDDRLKAGKYSFEYWLCLKKNGRTDNSYLERAIQHFQMAELNHINGFDIKEHSDSNSILGETEYWLATAFYQRYHDDSFRQYKKAPLVVRHENKKTGKYVWIRTTKSEQEQIKAFRHTQERYSRDPFVK